MKPILKLNNVFSKITMAIMTMFLSVVAFAQDKKVDVNINTKGDGGFFASPWVWVIGGILLIVLLVALLRPSGGGTTIVKE